MCRSLFLSLSLRCRALADEFRGNEREQGRSNRPSTERPLSSLALLPFRLSSRIHVVLPVSFSAVLSPTPAVAWKTSQCEIPPPSSAHHTFRLALCLFFFLSFSTIGIIFILLVVERASSLSLSFSLSSSLLPPPSLSLFLHPSLPPLSYPALRLSARGSFQLVPAETFHRPRPPFSAFFPSGFFSPPRIFLACLISGGYFSGGRKSRAKIAGAARTKYHHTACAINIR